MADTGHINFFNVDRCGLHKHNSKTIYGCDLAETCNLIKAWVNNRSLSETIPWDPSESRDDKPKCYCKDIYKDSSTGDYLLVLWKSDTDRSGSLYGVSEDDTNGEGDTVKFTNKHKGKKVIWGRPCYYWVAPKANTVASIKFEYSVTDAQMFEDYIIACINNRVNYPRKRKVKSDLGLTSIFFTNKEGDETKLRFRFQMSMKSLSTSSSELSKLARTVTHIVKREVIKVSANNDRAKWVSNFTKLMPYISTKANSKTRRVEITAEAKPNVKEIKAIIEKFSTDNSGKKDWNNVGFKTEKGITWVDKYRLKGTVIVTDKAGRLPNAKDVYNVVKKQRSDFIKILKDADKAKIAIVDKK